MRISCRFVIGLLFLMIVPVQSHAILSYHAIDPARQDVRVLEAYYAAKENDEARNQFRAQILAAGESSGRPELILLAGKWGASPSLQEAGFAQTYYSVLEKMAYEGKVDLLRTFLDSESFKGKTPTPIPPGPLYSAAMRNQIACAQCLLEHGANVNARHQDGTPLRAAVLWGSKEMVELLLKNGADPTSTGLLGKPPVLPDEILQNNRLSVPLLERLILIGADVTKYSTPQGEPLFLYAVKEGDVDVVKFLVDHGADMTVRDKTSGKNALYYAAHPNRSDQQAHQPVSRETRMEIVRFLVEKKIHSPLSFRERETILNALVYDDQKETFDFVVAHGIQPSSVAGQVYAGNFEAVRDLFIPTEVNAQQVLRYDTENLKQAFVAASLREDLELMTFLHDQIFPAYLRENVRTLSQNALEAAIKQDKVRAVKLLLEWGIRLENSPTVSQALAQGHSEISALLIQFKLVDPSQYPTSGYDERGDFEAIRHQMKAGVPVSPSAFKKAAEQGQLDILEHYAKTTDKISPDLIYECFPLASNQETLRYLFKTYRSLVTDSSRYGLAFQRASQLQDADLVKEIQQTGFSEEKPADLDFSLSPAVQAELSKLHYLPMDNIEEVELPTATGSYEFLAYLIKKGANANLVTGNRNGDWSSPFISALNRGDDRIINLLLDNLNASNVNGGRYSSDSNLLITVMMGRLDLVKQLVEKGANPNLETNGDTPYTMALCCGLTEIESYLREHGGNVNAYPALLHWVAEQGDLEMAKALFERGASVNLEGEAGKTPLHSAAAKGKAEMVKFLIEKGANVEAKDREGMTALHLAQQEGHKDVVPLLVQKIQNVESQGAMGRTPLHMAVKADRLEDVRALIEKGARVDAEDVDGETPLHLAARLGRPAIAQALLEKGAKPNARSKSGDAPLHLAAHWGEEEVCKVLLARGADPNQSGLESFKPLHWAAYSGKGSLVDTLVKTGALVDAATTGTHSTALHVAAIWGKEEAVRQLLAAKANRQTQDDIGYTPLDWALAKKQDKAVEILKDPQTNAAAPKPEIETWRAAPRINALPEIILKRVGTSLADEFEGVSFSQRKDWGESSTGHETEASFRKKNIHSEEQPTTSTQKTRIPLNEIQMQFSVYSGYFTEFGRSENEHSSIRWTFQNHDFFMWTSVGTGKNIPSEYRSKIQSIVDDECRKISPRQARLTRPDLYFLREQMSEQTALEFEQGKEVPEFLRHEDDFNNDGIPDLAVTLREAKSDTGYQDPDYATTKNWTFYLGTPDGHYRNSGDKMFSLVFKTIPVERSVGCIRYEYTRRRTYIGESYLRTDAGFQKDPYYSEEEESKKYH
jgi:ankyrin repeat protein